VNTLQIETKIEKFNMMFKNWSQGKSQFCKNHDLLSGSKIILIFN
jgi:hypothetical protein